MGNIRHIPGYKILRKLHVYSPKSVVSAIEKGKFRSYWVSTETYEVLKVYIDMNIDGLKDSIIEMLGGGRCNIDRKRRSFYSKYENSGRVCSCYAGRKVECRQSISKTLLEKFCWWELIMIKIVKNINVV